MLKLLDIKGYRWMMVVEIFSIMFRVGWEVGFKIILCMLSFKIVYFLGKE